MSMVLPPHSTRFSLWYMNSLTTGDSKRCSWCGTLNSVEAHTCSKCGAILPGAAALVENVSSAPEAASPKVPAEDRPPQYQDVIAPLVDETLFDTISGQAMRSLGMGPAFRSAQLQAYAVAGSLSLFILLTLMGAVVDISQTPVLLRSPNGIGVSPSRLTPSDGLLILVRISLLGIGLLTAVLFLIWIYRAHKNLRALGAFDLKYSPGWAIGGFFVPFLNLVRPYQVVMEIWRSSAPEVMGSFGAVWKHEGSSLFIALWWGAWLFSRTLDSMGSFMILGAGIGDQLSVGTRFRLVTDVMSILSAALAMMVVLKINARQETANRLAVARAQREIKLNDSEDQL